VIGEEEENLAGEIEEDEEQRGGKCMQFVTSIIMSLPT
jgi:hypothetical protein